MARYRVTLAPGAPVPGVGFFKPGDIFDAPSGYVPSRTMEPMDADAQAALAKLGVQKTLGVVSEAKVHDDTKTLAELDDLLSHSKGKRVADRKV